MTETTTPNGINFVRGKVLMWVLIVLIALVMLHRTPAKGDIISLCIAVLAAGVGVAVFVTIAEKVSKYFLHSKIKDPAGVIYWNIGLCAYLVLILLVWLAGA